MTKKRTACRMVLLIGFWGLFGGVVQCGFGEPDVTSVTLPNLVPGALSEEGQSSYDWHKNARLTWFYNDENSKTCFDSLWWKHYGGKDHPYKRENFYPAGFTPGETPFYIALPINDGLAESRRTEIPWYDPTLVGNSLLKNRWIQIKYQGLNCYGQLEDCLGDIGYYDFDYVFRNTAFPYDASAIDVSPAVRDCLGVEGIALVDWRFVDDQDVPTGPWTTITTTRARCHYGCQ